MPMLERGIFSLPLSPVVRHPKTLTPAHQRLGKPHGRALRFPLLRAYEPQLAGRGD